MVDTVSLGSGYKRLADTLRLVGFVHAEKLDPRSCVEKVGVKVERGIAPDLMVDFVPLEQAVVHFLEGSTWVSLREERI